MSQKWLEWSDMMWCNTKTKAMCIKTTIHSATKMAIQFLHFFFIAWFLTMNVCYILNSAIAYSRMSRVVDEIFEMSHHCCNLSWRPLQFLFPYRIMPFINTQKNAIKTKPDPSFSSHLDKKYVAKLYQNIKDGCLSFDMKTVVVQQVVNDWQQCLQ